MNISDILMKTAYALPEIEVNEVIIILRCDEDFGEIKKGGFCVLSNVTCHDMKHVNAILEEVLKNQIPTDSLNILRH